MYSKGYADLRCKTAMVRYAKSVKSVCTSGKGTMDRGKEGVVNQVYDT